MSGPKRPEPSGNRNSRELFPQDVESKLRNIGAIFVSTAYQSAEEVLSLSCNFLKEVQDTLAVTYRLRACAVFLLLGNGTFPSRTRISIPEILCDRGISSAASVGPYTNGLSAHSFTDGLVSIFRVRLCMARDTAA
jgi:hypothetical protein